MWRTLRLGAALALAAVAMAASAAWAAPDLVLTGVLTGKDHETYRELSFRVPPGVRQLTVEFAYTGKEQRAVIDLGLHDPQRFRGWSGGNKARFTLAETFATPSYLAGPITPGEWKLILGVPNLRKDGRAEYQAKITFRRDDRFAGFAETPLRTGPAWYRGDLHMHTAHSDGSCPAQSGGRAPCPLAKTVEAAGGRGLDFIAVTEHNATSHHQALAELQPSFDRLLLIPGREITTFQGHLGVLGVVEPLEFQVGSPRAPSMDAVLERVRQAGGLAIINHPGLPSGEACMGCGWTAAADLGRIDAVEVLNGSTLARAGGLDAPFSGVPFWEARLREGRRLVGVGGSDNHDATRDGLGAVGSPVTVVYAEELSQNGVLAGLRSGRVFVDLRALGAAVLDVSARAGDQTAQMGGSLRVGRGDTVTLEVTVKGAEGGRLILIEPLSPLINRPAEGPLGGDETRRIEWRGDGRAGWLRFEVRGPDGRLWLLGNPIYIEARAAP